ncbi:MAG: AbrB/MazE/SpoVT family DNA-binding domain-containing protein [Spirochaetales bacterium]|nr:AbrB/MazE/SpoVT family DNA-binding domain-containing protein [Spirochaetales bacterium]
MKDNSIKNKFAATVTVGTKGQIVIPKEMREMFGIEPGDNLMLLADKKQGIAIPPKNMFSSFCAKIFGGKAVETDNDDEDSEEA